MVDLAQPFRRGMPQSPNAPQFRLTLERRHREQPKADGGSMSSEIIFTGGHVGTHIDALAHISHHGMLHGGVPAADVETAQGFTRLGVEEFPPFVGRAVLLDVAALHGTPHLPADYEISVSDLEAGAQARRGAAAARRRPADRHRLVPPVGGGPATSPGSATALQARAPRRAAGWPRTSPSMVGGETIAFEYLAPGRGLTALPVHTTMLVESGINILETMRLHDLLDLGVSEFTLVVNPLPLVGATGAPVRPLALLDS